MTCLYNTRPESGGNHVKNIVFIDSEIGIEDKRVYDIGAVRFDRSIFHSSDISLFAKFLSDAEFLCGHNIVHHDLKYLASALRGKISAVPIDTLYLSPLLFPKRPYHRLLKDDKLQSDELNNLVNDSKKAQALFANEITAFSEFPPKLKQIFYELLHDKPEFTGFFAYIDYSPKTSGFVKFIRHAGFSLSGKLPELIQYEFKGLICKHTPLVLLIKKNPIELAYALALIHSNDCHSVIPPWLLHHSPEIENIIKIICNTLCPENCDYCRNKPNIHKGLK